MARDRRARRDRQHHARRLGLTGALGTVAEHVDGVYTGELVGEMLHGEGKAVAVREIVERDGLVLDDCYAYSDSSNDLPMLSMVGHPAQSTPTRPAGLTPRPTAGAFATTGRGARLPSQAPRPHSPPERLAEPSNCCAARKNSKPDSDPHTG